MKLDDIKKLHQKKYRQELGYFLVEGEHLILELEKAVATQPELAQSIIYTSESYGGYESSLDGLNLERVVISDKRMQQLSDTKTPQGVIALVPLSALSQQNSHSTLRTIYLHEVQDPGNLGTILRTLAWFGGFSCILSPNSVDPFNPKVVRASMGAIFHVPIEIDASLDSLQDRFDSFACLDVSGKSLSSPEFSEHQCFIFGNEARGVPREEISALNAQAYSIQGRGLLESLNLATAVNMCAYELNR